MSKAFALAAFNTAVVITNAAHAAKRGVVAAASLTKDNAVAGATASKEAGTAFWAGVKYAHQHNKANAAAAERLTAEDIEANAADAECPTPEVIEAPQPKAAKTRTVAKRSAK